MRVNVICLQILKDGIVIGFRKRFIKGFANRIVPVGKVKLSQDELNEINSRPLSYIGEVLIVDYTDKTKDVLLNPMFIRWNKEVGQHNCRFEEVFK